MPHKREFSPVLGHHLNLLIVVGACPKEKGNISIQSPYSSLGGGDGLTFIGAQF